MAVDLIQIRKLAKTREDENFSFRRFLKTECNLEPDEVDQRVFEITRRVWGRIDCTTCARDTWSGRTTTVTIPGRLDPLPARS